MGHVLTPTHKVVDHGSSYGGGGYGGGMPASNSGGEDKIIIINNGPPGSVTTTDVGSGTTVINTGSQQPTMQQPTNTQLAPINPVPMNPTPDGSQANNAAPVYTPAVNSNAAVNTPVAVAQNNAASQPNTDVIPNISGRFDAPLNTNANTNSPVSPDINASPSNAETATPAPGGIICVPIRVAEPSPEDSTKMVEVEKIACYPAPPPEATPSTVLPTETAAVAVTMAPNNQEQAQTSSPDTSSTSTTTTTTVAPPLSASDPSLAPLAPLSEKLQEIPEGYVPLAPLFPNTKPDLLKLPGV